MCATSCHFVPSGEEVAYALINVSVNAAECRSARPMAEVVRPAKQRAVQRVANQELVTFIEAMSEDEQVDLVTLTWLGRGHGDLEDWDDLRTEAARVRNRRTASYLLGIPLLPDFLEEALAAFGRSCEEFEEDHL